MSEKNSRYQPIKDAIKGHDLSIEHPELVLGQRSTNGAIVGGTYPIQPEMASKLREIALDAIARLSRTNMTSYDGATVLDPEHGLWVLSEQFQPDSPFLAFIARLSDRDAVITADQAQSISLSFYAIGFGTEDNRIYFVREKARHINADAKTLFGTFDRPMRLITKSMISLDTSVDFILCDQGAAVFTAHAFERFIQDPADIREHVRQSVTVLSQQVSFGPTAVQTVENAGVKSLMTRGRLRSIIQRPYFKQLTIDRVAEKIRAKNLDPAHYIKDDRLEFDPKQLMFVLKLLDQKVWRGDFDDTLYSTNAATPEEA